MFKNANRHSVHVILLSDKTIEQILMIIKTNQQIDNLLKNLNRQNKLIQYRKIILYWFDFRKNYSTAERSVRAENRAVRGAIILLLISSR